MKELAIRPTHYKNVCITLYARDLERVDAMVAELRVRGFTKMSRSQLIRIALDRLELVPATEAA